MDRGVGKYQYILSAVNKGDVLTLAVVLAGAAIGLTTFVRLLSWLLDKYRNITMTLLTGFMLGSLSILWPWRSTANPMNPILPGKIDTEIMLSISIAMVGVVVVLSLTKISAVMKQSSKVID